MRKNDLSVFAKNDTALAMMSIFHPVRKGRRAGGLQYVHRHDGLTINVNVWRQLDARDQSVLLAILGIAGKAHQMLDCNTTVAQGQQLWLDLEPDNVAEIQKALVVKTVRYRLMQEVGMSNSSGNYQRLNESLERLAAVSIFVKFGDKGHWSMRLLSSIEAENGEIHIALNPRFAAALTGNQFTLVNLIERKNLATEVAQLLHAWLCAWLRPGQTSQINVEKLVLRIYGNPTTEVKERTLRLRRSTMIFALERLDDLEGWSVKLNGEIATIHRPKSTLKLT